MDEAVELQTPHFHQQNYLLAWGSSAFCKEPLFNELRVDKVQEVAAGDDFFVTACFGGQVFLTRDQNTQLILDRI